MSPVELERLPYSVGVSARDRHGTFYFASESRSIYKAKRGMLDCPELLFDFEESTLDVRGLFVSHKGDLFVGVKGFTAAPFGRTYRFLAGQGIPQLVHPYCFWGMGEDLLGRLYLGVYHERGDPDCVCKVLCSLNSGTLWLDISPVLWRAQTHVHHLAINPSSQYLYATLGDVDSLDGCWRSLPLITKALISGHQSVVVDSEHFVSRVSVGDPVYLFTGACRLETSIAAIDGNVIEFPDRIPPNSGNEDVILYKQNWLHKFHDNGNGCQYIGIAFAGDTVILSDDTAPKKNAANALIYLAQDIDDHPTTPEAAFSLKDRTGAWGCFFLEGDSKGGYWTAVRPVRGPGIFCYSQDARAWTVISIFPEQQLATWRREHTFRDFTVCQTGRNQDHFADSWLLSGSPGIIVRHKSGGRRARRKATAR